MTSRSPIHMLRQQVSILRPVTQTNDYGLPVLSWQTLEQNIPAKLQLLDGDSGTASREHLRYKVFLPVETDIRPVDRLQLAQRLFEVLVVLNPDESGKLKIALTTEVLP